MTFPRKTLAVAGLLFAIAVVPSAGAAAGLDDLRPAIGAAIVSTHPDGRTARLWLRADHSYAAEGRNGQRSGGAWALRGDKLCLSQRRPWPAPIRYCKTVPKVSPGASWTDTAFNGERVVNRLVPGG